MKRWTLVLLTAALVSITVGPALSQEVSTGHRELRSRIEQHYEVVPSSNAIALVPKKRGGDVRLIDISQGVIAINGVTVTGKELRDRLGPDADLIVQLSYLTADERRELFAVRAEADPGQETSRTRNPRASGDRVRIFGNIRVEEGEEIRGEAVAVMGSAHVDGEVSQQVVAVLGSVELGPKAIVGGDVVSVGG